jgi:hypothetical protein
LGKWRLLANRVLVELVFKGEFADAKERIVLDIT